MKRRSFNKSISLAVLGVAISSQKQLFAGHANAIKKRIFLTGGGYDLATIKYLTSLTGKENS
jgi:dipeptidase E